MCFSGYIVIDLLPFKVQHPSVDGFIQLSNTVFALKRGTYVWPEIYWYWIWCDPIV